MVDLEGVVDESDVWVLQALVQDHVRHTGSTLAERLLDNWELMLPRFVKVMPREYRKVLQQRAAKRRETLLMPSTASHNGAAE